MILRTSHTSRALFAVFQDVYINKKEDHLSNLNTNMVESMMRCKDKHIINQMKKVVTW